MKKNNGTVRRIIVDFKKYGLGIVIVIGVYFIMHKLFHAFCPIVLLTGFPCPGCGLTRSILYFMTGQFERSFLIHPMGCVIVLFVLYCLFYRYVQGKKVPKFKQIVIVIIFALWIVYFVRMHFYFPNKPPCTYRKQNLLSYIIKHFAIIDKIM